MFQEACIGLKETLIPMVICWRTSAGKVDCGIGAGMVINEEGWFVTAAHILTAVKQLEVAVKNKKALPSIGQVTHSACALGVTGASLDEALIFPDIDLGIAKLKNYTHPQGYTYPKLRVRDVQQGELLCRAGYPFMEGVKPKWNGGKFDLSNIFPVPIFVNEALVSRFVQRKDGIWIETSSPGLRGQSGGPLFDADGLICGIQVNTCHYPLNFQGLGGNQAFNVGRAIHVETVRRYLDDNKVKYYKEATP